MPNSFFKRSARWGPTPFKYSIGFDSMSGANEMTEYFQTKISETSCREKVIKVAGKCKFNDAPRLRALRRQKATAVTHKKLLPLTLSVFVFLNECVWCVSKYPKIVGKIMVIGIVNIKTDSFFNRHILICLLTDLP